MHALRHANSTNICTIGQMYVVKIGRSTVVDADFKYAGSVLPNVTYCRDLGAAVASDLSST